jgi:integrase
LSSRKFRKQTAERIKEIVETLIYYRDNGMIVPDKVTQNWLAVAPAALQAKLAKVGLVNVTAKRTCQELWETFIKQKTDVKPVTIELYRRCENAFYESFSPTELVEKITSEKLLEWKTALLAEYAPASVAGYLKSMKAVFNLAVRKDWLTKSPMNGIPRGSFVNRENDRIISMDEYAKLLEASPNQEWRTIIALARIGGLRCPSELKQLRWADINWTENRFFVRSPKTEQHEGRDKRIVPLFSELRTELDRHFLLDETKGNEFVIEQYQGRSWGLNVLIQGIAQRAGLGTIIRPFDNMRMSRSNEVLNRWGEIKESLWIGHSAKVMKDHYRMSDEDFSAAAE